MSTLGEFLRMMFKFLWKGNSSLALPLNEVGFVCTTDWTSFCPSIRVNPTTREQFFENIVPQFGSKPPLCAVCQANMFPFRWTGEFPVASQDFQLEQIMWCLRDFYTHYVRALAFQKLETFNLDALQHYQLAHRALSANLDIPWQPRSDYGTDLYTNLFIKKGQLPAATPFKVHWLMLRDTCAIALRVLEAGMVGMFQKCMLDTYQTSNPNPKDFDINARMSAILEQVRLLQVAALRTNEKIATDYRPVAVGVVLTEPFLKLEVLAATAKHTQEDVWFFLSKANRRFVQITDQTTGELDKNAFTLEDFGDLSACLLLAELAKNSAAQSPTNPKLSEMQDQYRHLNTNWMQVRGLPHATDYINTATGDKLVAANCKSYERGTKSVDEILAVKPDYFTRLASAFSAQRG